MLKTETKNIGALEVAVTQFAGRRNLSVLIDLSKSVGPTIAAAMGGGGLDAEIDVASIANTLFKTMDKSGTEKLIKDMLAGTHVNGRALDDAEFDRVFAGQDLWVLPKVLSFVVEVNFGNFSELAANVSKVAGQNPAPASED